jgi:hypothetical protein
MFWHLVRSLRWGFALTRTLRVRPLPRGEAIHHHKLRNIKTRALGCRVHLKMEPTPGICENRSKAIFIVPKDDSDLMLAS